MKTQKIFLTLSMVIVLVPFIAQAAWWNPLSWFSVSETSTIIETPASTLNPENQPAIIASEDTLIESTQSSDVNISTAQNASNDREISALKREIQELRSAVQLIPTTNSVSVPAPQAINNPVINEQILDTLKKLEQRIEALESKTKNQDYDKVIARIESLEKKPATQTEDQSSRIKDIIGRVNLLSGAGVIDGCGNAGDQCWRSMICDMGNVAYGKSGSYYENSLTCKDLNDLKY